MVKEVPLSQGKVALVDDWDYPRVSEFKWCAVLQKNSKGSRGHWYAKRSVVMDGKMFNVYLHRFLLGLPDAVRIDHKDGDGLNCTNENLRIASARQNAANTRLSNANTSGFKGVYRERSGAFRVRLTHQSRPQTFGIYRTAEEAARVFDAIVRRLHGEFAWTNFPDLDQDADRLAERMLSGGKKPTFNVGPSRIATDEQVIEIRRRYAAGGVKQKDLAAEFGLKQAMVNHIITGRTFKDVGELVPEERRRELHSIHMRKEQAA